MRLPFARALLGFLVLLVSGGSQAGELLDRPQLPDQFFGFNFRLPGGAYVGKGADKASQPEWGYGLSIHVRTIPKWWADLAFDGRIPLTTTAPSNGFLLSSTQQTIGARGRLPFRPGINAVVGFGGGGATLTARPTGTGGEGVSTSAALGYLTGGFEKFIVGTDASASYIGVEGTYNQYFPSKDVGFKGGLVEARLAFSYYWGGSDANDCW